VISNGPGDPEPVQYAVEPCCCADRARAADGHLPRHQAARARLRRQTYKLKFGHRGGNHPVMDLTTGKVEITSHNHGFAVDPDSLPSATSSSRTSTSNDQTLEGLRLKNAPAFSVQYHPEASPGPHDARYLFERFADLMREHHGARAR
jgi:carbamoyl-phosphate synthase small subunit